MKRTTLWIVAFTPSMAIGLVLMNDRIAGFAMVLAIVQGVVLVGALIVDSFLVASSGGSPLGGSKAGNLVAKVLAAILLLFTLWKIFEIL